MRGPNEVDYSISKIWIECRKCENCYPRFGKAESCNHCGYDEWAPYRPSIRNNLFGVLDLNNKTIVYN